MKEGREWRYMLTRQMSSECVHCVDFQWPKTTIPLSESVYRKSCISYRYFYTTVLYIVYSDHVRTLCAHKLPIRKKW